MTAQACDDIRYKGETWAILGDGLERYFDSWPRRIPKFEYTSTACYRGYTASWVISSGRLHVTDLRVLASDRRGGIAERSCSLAAAFPGRPKPVLADWLTGSLILAGGDIVRYVHAGFASGYARYLILVVRGGVVEGEFILSGEDYDRRRDDRCLTEHWRFNSRWRACRCVPHAYRKMRKVDYFDLSRGRTCRPRPMTRTSWASTGG